MEKVSFVVVDGNVLGYVNSLQPDTVGILSTSVIRGAVCTWMDGTMPKPMQSERIRPATLRDFKEFRVSTKGYDSDPVRYDFPTA